MTGRAAVAPVQVADDTLVPGHGPVHRGPAVEAVARARR